MTTQHNRLVLLKVLFLLSTFWFFGAASVAEAATLSLSPSTGVYQTGGTFTAQVYVNTAGQSINAADATIKFDTSQLTVVSVSRASSIFGLWVTEPTFSNTAGTISFSGGSPTGYAGSAGAVMSVTFRAKAAGTGKASFSSGSILANDGRGTNVLTAMNGGTYTIQAQTTAPAPEVVTEYVAPANTPPLPQITSKTHGDPELWYQSGDASLQWSLPNGVTGVRTLLDTNQYTIPTKVYEPAITTISLTDLPQGVSYFHLQFKNADGWGKVAHYRLAVDSERPTALTISQSEPIDVANPIQTLQVEAKDDTSPVRRFIVKVDSSEPFEVELEAATGTITLPAVEPGYHTVTVEAFDAAGNSIIEVYSFTVEAFDKPVFTEYPTSLTPGVIPVIKGQTRAQSEVEVTVSKLGAEPRVYTITAAESGEFTFIPEGSFETGVYDIVAIATDTYGARSTPSDSIRIAVQEAGYVRIGGIVVSFLSVLVPTVALLVLCIMILAWLYRRAKSFRRLVGRESGEALVALQAEFANLERTLAEQEKELQNARKSKQLTKAETILFETVRSSLKTARQHIGEEITDVTDLTS